MTKRRILPAVETASFQFPVGKSHLDDYGSLVIYDPEADLFQFPVGKSHLDDTHQV